jgi:hypothetical protein
MFENIKDIKFDHKEHNGRKREREIVPIMYGTNTERVLCLYGSKRDGKERKTVG